MTAMSGWEVSEEMKSKGTNTSLHSYTTQKIGGHSNKFPLSRNNHSSRLLKHGMR